MSFTIIQSKPTKMKKKRRYSYSLKHIGNRPPKGRRSTPKVTRTRKLKSSRYAKQGWAILVRLSLRLSHGKDAMNELDESLTTASSLLAGRMKLVGKDAIRRERGMAKGVLLRDASALVALRLCVPRKFIHGLLEIVA